MKTRGSNHTYLNFWAALILRFHKRPLSAHNSKTKRGYLKNKCRFAKAIVKEVPTNCRAPSAVLWPSWHKCRSLVGRKPSRHFELGYRCCMDPERFQEQGNLKRKVWLRQFFNSFHRRESTWWNSVTLLWEAALSRATNYACKESFWRRCDGLIQVFSCYLWEYK